MLEDGGAYEEYLYANAMTFITHFKENGKDDVGWIKMKDKL